LQEIPRLGLPLTEYPLPEVQQAWAEQEANKLRQAAD
jgi:hypothetical protein